MCVLFVTSSYGEQGYSVADGINTNNSSQLTFEVFNAFELDSEPEIDPLDTTINSKNQTFYFGSLSIGSFKENATLQTNKFQYLRSRAPPFTII